MLRDALSHRPHQAHRAVTVAEERRPHTALHGEMLGAPHVDVDPGAVTVRQHEVGGPESGADAADGRAELHDQPIPLALVDPQDCVAPLPSDGAG